MSEVLSGNLHALNSRCIPPSGSGWSQPKMRIFDQTKTFESTWILKCWWDFFVLRNLFQSCCPRDGVNTYWEDYSLWRAGCLGEPPPLKLWPNADSRKRYVRRWYESSFWPGFWWLRLAKSTSATQRPILLIA